MYMGFILHDSYHGPYSSFASDPSITWGKEANAHQWDITV